jgi:hypothetical protein
MLAHICPQCALNSVESLVDETKPSGSRTPDPPYLALDSDSVGAGAGRAGAGAEAPEAAVAAGVEHLRPPKTVAERVSPAALATRSQPDRRRHDLSCTSVGCRCARTPLQAVQQAGGGAVQQAGMGVYAEGTLVTPRAPRVSTPRAP